MWPGTRSEPANLAAIHADTSPLRQDSYNVSGVSRSSAGQYTVTFSTAFANAFYACEITPEATSTLGIWHHDIARHNRGSGAGA
jgi:hypothetical protein